MNGIVDDFLVGLVLIVSAGYVVLSLGPRSLRIRTFAASSRLLARLPAFFGLRRTARWLAASSADKSQGACGGCDNCGSEKTPASTGAAAEVRVPLSKIGKRTVPADDYNNDASRVDVAMPQLDRSFVRVYPSHAAADLADVEKLTSRSQLEDRNSNEK